MFLSNQNNAAKSYCLHTQPSLSFFASVVRRRSITPSREFWWSVIELLWPRVATLNALRARKTAPNSRSSTMGFCSNYTVCAYKKWYQKFNVLSVRFQIKQLLSVPGSMNIKIKFDPNAAGAAVIGARSRSNKGVVTDRSVVAYIKRSPLGSPVWAIGK